MLKRRNVDLIERSLLTKESLVLDQDSCALVVSFEDLDEFEEADFSLLFEKYRRVWIILKVDPEKYEERKIEFSFIFRIFLMS